MKGPKIQRLVVQHLEKVSGRILEEYPDVIREFIRRKGGVYALYRKDQLYYVGLATNLMARLKTHLRDRHRGAWDRFSVYLTLRDGHIKELESMLIRIVSPKGNKLGGRFVKSQNLLLQLHRTMSEADADRRASIIGGFVARRRRRAKGRRLRGAGALHGFVDRRLPLRAARGAKKFKASLRRDGRIYYKNKYFDTPNSAARAALGKRVSGWSFWRYRDTKGMWVPLRNLKR
jgi:hypothetical protein